MIRNRFAVFATALSLALPMTTAHAQTPNFQGRNALNQADATCTADGDGGSTRCVSYYHAAQNITILNNWGLGSGDFDPTGSAGSAQLIAEDAGLAATGLTGWTLPSTAMFTSIFSAVGGTPLGLDNQFYDASLSRATWWWTADTFTPYSNSFATYRRVARNLNGTLDFGSVPYLRLTGELFNYIGARPVAVFTGDVLVPVEPPVTTVPEPSTYALMAAGLAALGLVSRRRALVA